MNLSYIFVYLYNTIEKFIENKKIELLIINFERIFEFYGSSNDNIAICITAWLRDAYLYISDYENAWKYLKKSKYGSVEDIIYIRGNCEKTTITGEELLQILGSNTGLTTFGKENIENVCKLATIFLDDFHFQNKVNYPEYFLKDLTMENLSKADFDELKSYYANGLDFELWKGQYKSTQISKHPYPHKYHHYLFAGVPATKPYFEREAIPYIILVALQNKFKSIIRESENTIRSEKNLPFVGEGWISETHLFYKLSRIYPSEKVIHHGNPSWLKRQQIDIYFPHKNIGIEYQGVQHLRPINFFGGEENFKKIQELDKKKTEVMYRKWMHSNLCF